MGMPIVAGLLALPVPGGSGAAEAATCPYNNYHYYSEGWSGTGNYGTGAEELTWTSWALDGHNDADAGFSDEAVWTIDNNDGSDALEVGFATGYEGETGGFSNAMYPYYTTDNGNNEVDFPGTSLPKDTVIWNSATSNGTDSWAYVNNKLLAKIVYDVPQPRFSYEQTEVDYHDIWMGGGSGSNIAAEWQNASGAWNDWAYIDGETQAADLATGASSSPAGYGYFIDLDQPNGAVQGGYGKSC
jgi:hypothetical protein